MNIQKRILKSQELARIGKLDEAIGLLNEVITKFPSQPRAHSMLGLFYIFRKQAHLAKDHLEKSLSILFDPTTAENLIVLMMQTQSWTVAHQWSTKLIESGRYKVTHLINHAIILREIGHVQESEDCYQTIINKYPNNIEAKISYGFTLNKLEKFDEAIAIYHQGLLIDKKNYSLLYNLGISYLNHYDYDNALIYLNLAKEENNNSVDLWLTLAVCQAKKRDFREAFESVSFAEKIQPNNPLIPFQMGTLFMQQDNNDEALKFFKKALEYNPNHIEALFHIGLIKLKQEKYQEATQYYQNRTIRKNNRIGKFNDMSLPILDKNTDLIVAWEQGIGDQILLISLIVEIKDKVKSITYISQDKLYPLLKLNYPDLTVIKESESDEFIGKNSNYKKINIGSMMGYIDDWKLFFKKSHTWKVDQKLKKYYENTYKPKNQILMGISWMSANKKIGDEKTIPLHEFTQLIADRQVVSLQYGNVQDEISNVNSKQKCNIMHDQDLDYYYDLNGLAALVSICDIVITCSNVTAHIAGRLGVKTYLIIPKNFGNIWYWNSDNKGISKWYPSVQIFRQTTDGVWAEEIEKIKDLLTS